MNKFTRKAVAARLGVNVKTIDRLASRGKLRKVHLSARRVLIDPSSLREMLGDNLYAELFGGLPASPRADDKD